MNDKTKSLILNKIITLKDVIDKRRYDESIARQLEFFMSAQKIHDELKLLVEFRQWLLDLEVDK